MHRYAYNWGLAEWQRMREAGEKPSMRRCSPSSAAGTRIASLNYRGLTRSPASGQAIINLGSAFAHFLRDCKKPRKQRNFRYPKFKKKRLNESFQLMGGPVRP